MSQVYMHLAGPRIILSFDYNPHIISQVKRVPGTKWNKSLQRWEAPLAAYDQLVNTLDRVSISNTLMNKLSEQVKIARKVTEIRHAKNYELHDYVAKIPLLENQKKSFDIHRFLPGSANLSEMGAGKCLLGDSLCYVNGDLISAKDIWDSYATRAVRDGVGWWSRPNITLYVSSLTESGQIEKRPVTNLYRQRVKERLKIVKLSDGSEITITKAHKLYLTDKWDNEFSIGDYVCVPRSLPHESGALDVDTAALFGWRASGEARIPSSVMQADQKAVGAFIRGFFDAGGLVNRAGIRVSSTCPLLIKQLRALLLRFCIRLRVDVDGTNWAGVIDGPSVQIYKNKIGFSVEYKQRKLEQLLLKEEKWNEFPQSVDQDIHYVKIQSIEEIEFDGWVYDLEVSSEHNYVAENIICHNTGSAICAIHWRKEMGHIDRSLVVCPKAVIPGWEEQIQMFSDLTFIAVTGDSKKERLKKLATNKDVYLINYDYTWRILDELLEKNFGLVIADEAHRIKNPQSRQSKACYKLSDSAEYRIALTGSPILNTPIDAFGVMRFTDPSLFGESFHAFRNKYFVNVGKENSPIPIIVPRPGAEETISDKIYTRSIRFLKEECMDLPPATHAPNYIVTLSSEQDKAYRQLQEDLSAELTEQKSIKINHVLTLMLKLNQITSGWIKDTDTGEIHHFKKNPKFDALKEIVEDAGSQPIIIWAYYQEDMKLIIEHYSHCQNPRCKKPVNNIKGDRCECGAEIKYRCSEIRGSTRHRNAEIAKFRFTPEERARLRQKYIDEGKSKRDIRSELGDLLEDGSEPPQSNIIAVQCVAGSEGLNLQRATLSVFFSRNWSLKDWVQALARNHRKGQDKPVTYISIVARMRNGDDTVDQRIVAALQRKENLSRKMNKDDIRLLMGKKKAEVDLDSSDAPDSVVDDPEVEKISDGPPQSLFD